MSKRNIQEINAGSMADIAFLLLIFFLVTTTMSTDKGIMRKLPPIEEEPTPIPVNKRNILDVLVNRDNIVMVRGNIIEFSELKHVAKEFIKNEHNNPELPAIKQVFIPEIGEVGITTQHVISLQNHRGTHYSTYITVQNELTAAYNELRSELTEELWKLQYEDLDEKRKKAVNEVYPLRISEAEPYIRN